MKKIIVLIVFTLISICSFSQVNDTVIVSLKEVGETYSKANRNVNVRMTFNEWQIHQNEFIYKDSLWFKTEIAKTPGNLLMSGKNLQVAGNLFLLSSTITLTIALTRTPDALIRSLEINENQLKNLSKDLEKSKEDLEKFNKNTKTMIYCSGGMAIVGIILNLSGMNKINQAGILLNENGIGLSIPIK